MVSGSSGIQQTEQLEFKVHTPFAHGILFSGTKGWIQWRSLLTNQNP